MACLCTRRCAAPRCLVNSCRVQAWIVHEQLLKQQAQLMDQLHAQPKACNCGDTGARPAKGGKHSKKSGTPFALVAASAALLVAAGQEPP